MAIPSLDGAEEGAAALRAIVAEHGPEVLSSPAMMSNLLADLLPSAARLVRLLAAAAEDHIGDKLREHASGGMDLATAVRLTASAFADVTMFTPDACAWVVGAFADALGMGWDADRPPTIVARQQSWSTGAGGDFLAVQDDAADGHLAAGPGAAMTVYVVNGDDGTVTPIDVATGTTRTPIKVGPSPAAIAVTPDGTVAFVANGGDSRTVTPVELSGGVRGAPIRIEHEARAIAITPDGARCYVAGGEDVTAISVSDREAGAPVKVGTGVIGIVISPDGRAGYALDNFERRKHPGDYRERLHPGAVISIDLAAGKTSRRIEPVLWRNACDDINEAGGGFLPEPTAIAIAPDGMTAYVASDNSVTPIDLPTGTAHMPVRVEGRPVAIAITSDGSAACVCLAPGWEGRGEQGIVRIDLATGRCAAPIRTSCPTAIAIHPGGASAYAACGDGTVTPIDIATNKAGESIIVGRGPVAIVIARRSGPGRRHWLALGGRSGDRPE